MPDRSFKINDVFISYSRQNLDFAKKLYHHLMEEDLEVWFDQENIPLAVDFLHEIESGINLSHNFIFIISPESILSEYCLIEIKHALKQGKRIIPVLFEEPDTFTLTKAHPEIKKLNWIFFREGLDNFHNSLLGLLDTLDQHAEYVSMHTHLLNKALFWSRNQKRSESLLMEEDRIEAEAWLKTTFDNDIPPCDAVALQSEFICESEKYAKLGMTEVFICNEPADYDIAVLIGNELMKNSFTIWIRNEDLVEDNDKIRKVIKNAIEQADNFLYLISPESLISDRCNFELNYAKTLNKRIIPLIVKRADTQILTQNFQFLSYIDFSEPIKVKFYTDVFKKAFNQLLIELYKNQHYYEQHKYLLVQALHWKRQNENIAILIKGYQYQNARSWCLEGQTNLKHPPIELHKEFLDTCESSSAHLQSEIYISYARNDSDFARRLNNDLQINGRVTWMEQNYIPNGVDYQEETFKAIESSDNYLLIASPFAIQSPYCRDELEYAHALGKRIIIVKYRDCDLNLIVDHDVQYTEVNFEFLSNRYAECFSNLLRELDVDRDYIRHHNQLSQKALEWEQKDFDTDFLLRGTELIAALDWYKDALEKEKAPAPSPLQIKLINKSEEQADLSRKKYKQRINRLRVLVVVMAISLISAGYFAYKLEIARVASEENEKLAYELREEAIKRQETLELQKKRLDSLQVLQDKLNSEFRKPAFQRNETLIRELLNIKDSLAERINQQDEVDIQTQMAEKEEEQKLFEFHDGLAVYELKGKYGFIDEEENIKIEPIYDGAGRFSDGLAKVRKNGKWGYINTSGELIIDFQFDLADNFENDTARVRQFNVSYQIDRFNTCLNNCEEFKEKQLIGNAAKKYEATGNILSEGLLRVQKNGKWGFIDSQGNITINFKYDAAENFKNGNANVVYNNQAQVINLQGICIENCVTELLDFSKIDASKNIRAFNISKYEITNTQFKEFLNTIKKDNAEASEWINLSPGGSKNASQGILWNGNAFEVKFGYDKKPVCFVSYYGAEAFCKWAGGRLPNVKEWELATSGKSDSTFYTYGGTNNLQEIVWLQGLDNKLCDVDDSRFPANTTGLKHTSGNVWEWCTLPNNTNSAVLKGGSLTSGPNQFKPAYNNKKDKIAYDGYFGFRMVKIEK
ncbi:TIR domain-containing protein [Chondrinema litorale]|uniref:TIR domain-containing protein n=1 Tax=Chondrinema litorale TaxID=2994555 RepID=UPI002543051C|nr:TIR domain-containing protein [Chondrinema litorale]UZR94997.1 TIR domain-containing protein [Chondrinema litorale]